MPLPREPPVEQPFTPDHITELAKIAGLAELRLIDKLETDLRDLGSGMVIKEYQDDTTAPIQMQRSTLTKIANHLRKLLDLLNQADKNSRALIFGKYQIGEMFEHEAPLPSGEPDMKTVFAELLMPANEIAKDRFHRDIQHVERLSIAAAAALAGFRKGGGRPDIGIAKFAAPKLAVLYEKHTSRTFRVVNENHGGDTRPTQFVAYALKVLSPNLKESNLNTALAHAVTVLGQQQRTQEPPGKSQ